MDVPGKDLVSGTPKALRVTDAHIREALAEPVRVIVQAVRKALDKTPPELAGDILNNGVLMAGGGSLLKGLDTNLFNETRLKIVVDENPLTTVVRGTGKTIENPAFYQDVFIN